MPDEVCSEHLRPCNIWKAEGIVCIWKGKRAGSYGFGEAPPHKAESPKLDPSKSGATLGQCLQVALSKCAIGGSRYPSSTFWFLLWRPRCSAFWSFDCQVLPLLDLGMRDVRKLAFLHWRNWSMSREASANGCLVLVQATAVNLVLHVVRSCCEVENLMGSGYHVLFSGSVSSRFLPASGSE